MLFRSCSAYARPRTAIRNGVCGIFAVDGVAGLAEGKEKLPQTSLLTYLAGAIALVGLLLVFRRQEMTFFFHFSTRWALTDAGRRAIEKQPDEIHLVRRDSHTWKNEQTLRGQVEPLLALGFENIGTFAIDNLTAVIVRFLLREEESLYAVVYEHEKAGVWLNLISLYQDGNSVTFTTSRDRGLEKDSKHPIVYAPSASPAELYRVALAKRPQKPFKEMSAEVIVPEFEKAYAERMRWRKKRGFSPEEVARVAKTRAVAVPEQSTSRKIQFLGDQDGPPERALKDSLARLFPGHSQVLRAYLARVKQGDSPAHEVALCLVSPGGHDTALVQTISGLFRSLFKEGARLDVIFLREDQEVMLQKVCAPFFTRPTN